MENILEFKSFRSPSDAGWEEAWKLYEESFPRKETRSLADHLRALEDPRFTADGIWLDGEFVGLFYYWHAPGDAYAEHFAILPTMRGVNIGSRVLAEFCQRFGRVVLEIDPPETEIAQRRQRFYERMGFIANDYLYIHPSFQRPCEPHQLILMSYPEPMTEAECHALEQFVRNPVLRYSCHGE